MKRALLLLLCLFFALSARAETPLDQDLTPFSSTVVYSQIYDIMTEPRLYLGQRMKLKGRFDYYQNPWTQREYFSALVSDATACCALGFEFDWAGDHSYPSDYPPQGTEITVTGIFDIYRDDGMDYERLIDAQVTWDNAENS